MERFTERLSYLMRDVLEITGNGLARELNMNQGLVSRYRKGETKPPADFITKLCDLYGISANWLLLGIEPIYLIQITPSQFADFRIQHIQCKKELGTSLNDVIECINKIKEKNGV